MHQSAGERQIASNRAPIIWGALLTVWLVMLCILPDPRPLGAPAWAVRTTSSLSGLSEAPARLLSTVLLRGAGIGVLGILFSLTLVRVPLRYAVPIGLISAPVLAFLAKWVNYGFLPIRQQIQLAVISSIFGVLIGLGLRRHWLALAVLIILMVGLFAWGTSTRISDDLAANARAVGQHLLAYEADIPSGDAGFAKILELAFTFAEENSHGTDTDVVPMNKAAILALGVIFGDGRVADVARRTVDPSQRAEIAVLRNRITLRGRGDLSQHFFVSAALTILTDEDRSLTVGIAKELMDAVPGGSGFSFVDMLANRAGILFAMASTRDAQSARDMQLRIRAGVNLPDFFPEIDGLPEGLSSDEFHAVYGGLGGEGTRRIEAETLRRLTSCSALHPS